MGERLNSEAATAKQPSWFYVELATTFVFFWCKNNKNLKNIVFKKQRCGGNVTQFFAFARMQNGRFLVIQQWAIYWKHLRQFKNTAKSEP